MTKICTKCKEEKNLEAFHTSKQTLIGRVAACKVCVSTSNKIYRDNNREARNKQKRDYAKKNLEKIKEQARRSYQKNKKPDTEEQKLNKKIYMKGYRAKNKDKINAQRRKYCKERLKIDPMFKLQCALRTRINDALNKKRIGATTFSLIGCSFIEVKEHLEKQFTEGMCWENYGLTGWHVDHIVPLSSAKTEEACAKLCHYTNLQPLWAEDNLQKYNKI